MPEKNEVRDKCLTTENPFLVRKLQLAMIFESSDRIYLLLPSVKSLGASNGCINNGAYSTD